MNCNLMLNISNKTNKQNRNRVLHKIIAMWDKQKVLTSRREDRPKWGSSRVSAHQDLHAIFCVHHFSVYVEFGLA
jgi:hypothetical protein